MANGEEDCCLDWLSLKLHQSRTQELSMKKMIDDLFLRIHHLESENFELRVERDFLHDKLYPKIQLPSIRQTPSSQNTEEPMESQSLCSKCVELQIENDQIKKSYRAISNSNTKIHHSFVNLSHELEKMRLQIEIYSRLVPTFQKKIVEAISESNSLKPTTTILPDYAFVRVPKSSTSPVTPDDEPEDIPDLMTSQSTTGLNPPIPSEHNTNTGSIFQSTDDNPLPVSSIGTRAPGSTEGKHHAGVKGDIMHYIKNQYLALTAFTWSTSDLPGTIKFVAPISPRSSNSVINYLSGLFNCWGGGLDYLSKIAGTALHAGSLMMARLPPNINPQTIKTVEQLSHFEFSVIDPKTLEAVNRSVTDQRQIMFHFMNDEGVNAIGGYIVIMVMQQLNTSSSGTNQIDVQVFNKASSDFDMFQIVPPSITPIIEDQGKWKNLFVNSAYLTQTGSYVTSVRTGTSTGNPVGMRTTSGALLHTPGVISRSLLSNVSTTFASTRYSFLATSSSTLIPVDENLQTLYQPISFSSGLTPLTAVSLLSGGSLSLPSTVNLANSITVTNANVGQAYSLNFGTTFSSTYGGPVLTAPNGELFVNFRSTTANGNFVDNLTTSLISSLFSTGEFRLPSNQVAVLRFIDIPSQLPIADVKVYQNGYMTVSDQTSFDLPYNSFEVIFLEYAASSVAFQSPSQEMRMARALLSMRQMKMVSQCDVPNKRERVFGEEYKDEFYRFQTEEDYTDEEYVRDLCADGDVESNPGPCDGVERSMKIVKTAVGLMIIGLLGYAGYETYIYFNNITGSFKSLFSEINDFGKTIVEPFETFGDAVGDIIEDYKKRSAEPKEMRDRDRVGEIWKLINAWCTPDWESMYDHDANAYKCNDTVYFINDVPSDLYFCAPECVKTWLHENVEKKQ